MFFEWLNNCFKRYFPTEESIVFIFLLLVILLTILFLGNILAPVIISIIIAFLLQGLVRHLNKFLPYLVSVVISFIFFLGVALTILFLALPILGRQLKNLVIELPKIIDKVHHFLNQVNINYPDAFALIELDKLTDHTVQRIAMIGQSLLSFSIETIPNLFALLVYAVLIPLLVFFFMKDREQLLAWLGQYLPENRPLMRAVWLEMNQQVANYARGKAIEVFVVGISTLVLFSLMRQNYAVLLGVLVGLSVIVPYIGAVIVTIPVAIIGFFQWGWTNDFFYLMLVYGIIQFLDGNVLVPLLFSEAVNLHPVAIIIAVLVFGGLWGVWGVFFAIPLATLIKALLKAWPNAQAVIDANR